MRYGPKQFLAGSASSSAKANNSKGDQPLQDYVFVRIEVGPEAHEIAHPGNSSISAQRFAYAG